MNSNLDKAILDLGKVDALMYAFENTFLDSLCVSDDPKAHDRVVSAFYAIWDSIERVSEDLDRLCGDAKVIDVIYAVNASRKDEI